MVCKYSLFIIICLKNLSSCVQAWIQGEGERDVLPKSERSFPFYGYLQHSLGQEWKKKD